jgi:hypothetical protein
VLLDRTWNAGDLLKQTQIKEMIRENSKFKKQIEAEGAAAADRRPAGGES